MPVVSAVMVTSPTVTRASLAKMRGNTRPSVP